MNEVLEILEALDVNSRRIECRFDPKRGAGVIADLRRGHRAKVGWMNRFAPCFVGWMANPSDLRAWAYRCKISSSAVFISWLRAGRY